MDVSFLLSATGLVGLALLLLGLSAAILGIRAHPGVALAGAASAAAGAVIIMIAAGALSADWWPLGLDGLRGGQ